MPDPEMIYEIVDRLSGKRVTEVVYRTASEALDRLSVWATQYGDDVEQKYRVQGVKISDR